jgi:hypothetical protein
MAMRIRHGIRAIITLATVGASIALVACGGSDSSGEDAEASAEDAALEFARCMRENGVDIPDPKADSGGEGFSFEFSGDPRQNENFEEAQEACGDILEEAIPEGERRDPAEIRDELHQMAECLRDKGYDVPEPQVVGPGEDPPENPEPPSEEFQDLMDDPKFQRAQEDCAEQAGLPGGGPGLQIGSGGGGEDGPSTQSDSGE